MGAITYDMENTSSIPAGKLFKAFLLDSDNLIPKILPHAFKSVEILEGDGGAGTIKLITFGEGSQFKSVKHHVDSIDKENLTYSYSIIEGDALMDILESITYHIKIVPTADGGSICVMVASAYGAIIFNLPQVLHRHCKQTKPNESIHPSNLERRPRNFHHLRPQYLIISDVSKQRLTKLNKFIHHKCTP